MTASEPTTTAVDTLHLYEISHIVTQTHDWNEALDLIVSRIRNLIIFDNLAVYIVDPIQKNLDVMYARAVGRGRSAEADLATRILDNPQTMIIEPKTDSNTDRLGRPYLLGIPLEIGQRTLGAVIFIRFGGPPFNPQYIKLATFISQQISLLVERQNLQITFDKLEEESHESRQQEDFISTITHELRTPLGFIKGYTTTLLRSDTTWDQNTQLEFLRIIDQETDRLQDLIENLLDSARLQSGTMKLEFQAVRLDSLIRSIVDRVQLHNPEFEAHLDFDSTMLPIHGDPKRLGQVLENLFSNAIKYAPGSPVWVKIKINAGEAFIDVIDHGPGIPNRYITHIFERFFRNPDLSPSLHGSGLGLFICKKIIQAHRGSISATSVVGQGTTFHIWLPKNEDKREFGGELREEMLS
jgi:signal transduction histidine kinase